MTPQRWFLVHDGQEHIVQIAEAGLRRSITWRVDDAEIGHRRTSDERVVIDGGERGSLGVRLPEFTGPARRVTWYPADAPPGAAHLGLGGIDLVPEPGSRAAAREKWIRDHPRLYVASRTLTAVLGVLLPVLLFWLLAQVRVPWPTVSIPWPAWDLPSLPSLPWPDLRIPWPDWSLPELPPWLRAILEKAKYVGPVLLALGVARAEVRRRRQQDERRAKSMGDADQDAAAGAGPPAERADG